MQKKTFVVLGVEEVKDAVANHFVKHLTNSPDYFMKLVREGRLNEELPDLGKTTNHDLIRLYRDHRLGANVVQEQNVDAVVFQNGEVLEVVHENRQ